MGIKVIDTISVANTGLSLSNIILTIRGNFIVRKRITPTEEIQPDNTFLKTIYEIQTTVYYLVNEGNTPLFIEDTMMNFDTVNIDLFSEIYSRLKARYSDTVDV
jgi:hypothetical protein